VEAYEADLISFCSPFAYFVFTSPCSTLLVSNRSAQRRNNPLEPPIIIKYPKEGLLRFGLQDARVTYLFDFINNDNNNGRCTESAFFGCVYVMFSYDDILVIDRSIDYMNRAWNVSVWRKERVVLRIDPLEFGSFLSKRGVRLDPARTCCAVSPCRSCMAQQQVLAIVLIQILEMHEITILT
jgi:hypothetical protein